MILFRVIVTLPIPDLLYSRLSFTPSLSVCLSVCLSPPLVYCSSVFYLQLNLSHPQILLIFLTED
jgi:hypothetical protein